jgi:hypothetical protein
MLAEDLYARRPKGIIPAQTFLRYSMLPSPVAAKLEESLATTKFRPFGNLKKAPRDRRAKKRRAV